MRAKYPIGPILHAGGASVALVATMQTQEMSPFAGNTLAVLPNMSPGSVLTFIYRQDGTGGRSLTFNSAAIPGGAAGCGAGSLSPSQGAGEYSVFQVTYSSVGAVIAKNVGGSDAFPALTSNFYTFDPDNAATLTLVGSAIQAAADAGGGLLVLAAPAAGQRPTRTAGALNGRAIAAYSRDSVSALLSAAGSPTGDTSHTVIAVVRIRDITTVTNDFDPIVMLGDGGANTGICRYGYAGGLNLLASGRGSNQFPYSTAWGGEPDGRSQVTFTTSEWLVLAIRYNAATSRRELWINGEIHSSYAVADTALTAAFGLGSIGGTTVDMDVAFAAYSSAAIPDSEMNAAHAWLAEHFNLWLPARATVLGDSLSQSQRPTPYGLLAGGWIGQADSEGQLSTGGLSINYKNTAISGYAPADYTVTTIALPGGGTITRLALAAWRYNAMRRAASGRRGSVAVVWLASNDAVTPAEEWAKTQTILATLRAAGFRTIIATSIWRVDQTADHVVFDALIRAGSADWDFLVDLDLIPEYQSLTASYTEDDGLGPATDGVHLRKGIPDGGGLRTRADGNGYGRIGYLFKEAIHSAL